MTAITDFRASAEDGTPLAADAHGNNVAFKCIVCGGPLLAVMLPHQRGSAAEKATICRLCGTSYWVQAIVAESRLVIHRLASAHSGRYSLAREPSTLAKPNSASWSVVSAILQAYGGAEYEDLCVAVRQHAHATGGKAFIDYCVRNGWLERSTERAA